MTWKPEGSTEEDGQGWTPGWKAPKAALLTWPDSHSALAHPVTHLLYNTMSGNQTRFAGILRMFTPS